MLKRAILWSAAALAVIVMFSERPVQAGKTPPPPVYTHTLRWLGVDDSVFESWGYGLNNNGDVVGHAYWHVPTETDPDGWIGEAFLCTKATGEIVNLNRVVQVPPGAILGQAYDINDSGQIIGEMWFKDETGEYVYAYRYTPANQDNGAVAKLEVLTHTQGTIHTVGNIGEPTDISISYVTTINDFGDMLVYSDTLHVPCIFTAAGELLPIPRSDGVTWGTRDINNFCQVAGYFPTGQFVPHTPVRYTPPNVFTTFGWLKSPGKSPSGMALGINDNGVVTGYMNTLGGGVSHAFRYSDEGGLNDLGGLGDLSTRGNSINSAGSVAGDAGSGSGGTAFAYLAGRGMFDLKKSTTAVPSTLLQFGMTARRINDQEWVLGKIGHYAYLLERLPPQ